MSRDAGANDQTRRVANELRRDGRSRRAAADFARFDVSGLFAARALARDDELSRRSAAAMERLNPGAVLKDVGTTTTTEESGEVTNTLGTAEITELKATPVDDAMLDLPQGYRRMEFPMPMGRP